MGAMGALEPWIKYIIQMHNNYGDLHRLPNIQSGVIITLAVYCVPAEEATWKLITYKKNYLSILGMPRVQNHLPTSIYANRTTDQTAGRGRL